MQSFESSDEHWEKSLAASAEARRQAHLVEEQSQSTHVKLLAAQEATRDFDKARREHMALEVCAPCLEGFEAAQVAHCTSLKSHVWR